VANAATRGMVVLVVVVVVLLEAVVMAETHSVVVNIINNQRLNASYVGRKDTLSRGAGKTLIKALLVKRRSCLLWSHPMM
jgi:hypothetical protein